MDDSRRIEHDLFVAARLGEVWAAFTTEEGARTFFAPDCRIEARPNGPYELYFDLDAPAGSRGSEGCRVIEVDPPRRLAFTWNFPPHLSIRGEQTRVDVRLESEADGTRVRVIHSEWRRGGEWDVGYEYFDRAWRLVLARLQHRFAEGPLDWTRPYRPSDL